MFPEASGRNVEILHRLIPATRPMALAFSEIL
jgi:hypothetical protein